MIQKKTIALFFIVFFMAITSAPTIISSIDNSIDTAVLFGFGEEEEEKEDAKLLFEIVFQDLENFISDSGKMDSDTYTYKQYLKPHLNIIFPPPEIILV
ncbi:hypothetical protein [Winogradskyella flava]|uniref:Uncharacterized protein n=1 Tax=Winogradskyella flava TaxID=1884876 RepID=A0A842IMW1_9FLAO|nr:hypothetical protein [Winogradskyella flava]MBC2844081.1 hypothetical protein [Winogradskyella flava]